MRQILPLSTQSVSYYLRNSSGTAVTPTSLSLAVTNESGTAVTIAGAVTLGTPSTLTVASTEIAASLLYQTLDAKWVGAYGGSTLTDYEEWFVVRRLIENGPLATVKDCRDACGLTDTSQDSVVFNVLESACAIARKEARRRLTIGQVTESRKLNLRDDYVVFPDELRSITSITDPDGVTLTEDSDYEITYGDGDFIEWVEFSGRDYGTYTIAGVWGWDDPPVDARDAVVDIVSMTYKLRHASMRTEFGPTFPIDLPNSARDKLRRLRRRKKRRD